MSRCDRWRCLDAGVPTSSQTFDNPAKELSRGNLSSCCLGTRRSWLRLSLLVVNTSMLYHHRVRCYLLFGERTPIFGFFASFTSLEVMFSVACNDTILHQLSEVVCSVQRCVSPCMSFASFVVNHLQFKIGVRTRGSPWSLPAPCFCVLSECAFARFCCLL